MGCCCPYGKMWSAEPPEVEIPIRVKMSAANKGLVVAYIVITVAMITYAIVGCLTMDGGGRPFWAFGAPGMFIGLLIAAFDTPVLLRKLKNGIMLLKTRNGGIHRVVMVSEATEEDYAQQNACCGNGAIHTDKKPALLVSIEKKCCEHDYIVEGTDHDVQTVVSLLGHCQAV
eukprot:TRINITY_DN79228_c0_g1_i1.p2 TRINITY_DN79228_c0_g1~~TRINITY_DN79228_c0_g1_i1.p2  ORF type:complete len:172 (+),score=19.19 TRINITY_DN79228_c0_g1_i1:49-564(+)